MGVNSHHLLNSNIPIFLISQAIRFSEHLILHKLIAGLLAAEVCHSFWKLRFITSYNLSRMRVKTKCKSEFVGELQYVDDVTFVSHREQDLQRVFNSVEDAYHRFRLKISPEKTEIMMQKTGTEIDTTTQPRSALVTRLSPVY